MNGLGQYPDALAAFTRGLNLQGIAQTYIRSRELRIKQERQDAKDRAAAEEAIGERDMNRLNVGFKIFNSYPESEQNTKLRE